MDSHDTPRRPPLPGRTRQQTERTHDAPEASVADAPGPPGEQRIGRGLAILVVAIGLLWLIAEVQARVPVLRDTFRGYALLSDVLGEPSAPTTAPPAADGENTPASDTLAARSEATMAAEVPVQAPVIPAAPALVYPDLSAMTYTGIENLGAFFDALARSGSESARVLYFGDSMIEGDLVTQTVRSQLQQRFGGEGVGLLPIVDPAARFRGSIRAEAEGEWVSVSQGDDTASHSVDLTGAYHLPLHDAALYIERGSASRRGRLAPAVRLFHGPVPSHSRARVTVETEVGAIGVPVKGGSPINALDLPGQPAEELSLYFGSNASVPFYAVSFESATGVLVDNLAVRGRSGLDLAGVPLGVLRAYDRLLGPDLVVIQVGVNVVRDDADDFGWYRSRLAQSIRHLRRAFPDASVLVVSATDMADRIDGVVRTRPNVLLVVQAQAGAAEDTGAAFLNLFGAMGGRDAIVRWAEADPPLARLDYVHVNPRGAERLGTLVTDYLLEAYDAR